MNLRSDEFEIPTVSPVVIIGMHRSGTSLLAKTLGQCGLFLGKDTQGDHESVLFMLANNNIFARCYTAWNRPFSVHCALEDETVTDSLARSVNTFITSESSKYLGSNEPRASQGLAEINFPWGWKDPRNTFTLPVWARIFPGLKVIHVLRHGVDAAHSLYRRDILLYKEWQKPYWPALSVARDRFGLFYARPTSTMEQAFLLWEEYVEKAVQQVQIHGTNALQFKYEDLLFDAKSCLTKILRFCGLGDHPVPSAVVETFNPERAYNYRKTPELVEFADRWAATLSRFGY